MARAGRWAAQLNGEPTPRWEMGGTPGLGIHHACTPGVETLTIPSYKTRRAARGAACVTHTCALLIACASLRSQPTPATQLSLPLAMPHEAQRPASTQQRGDLEAKQRPPGGLVGEHVAALGRVHGAPPPSPVPSRLIALLPNDQPWPAAAVAVLLLKQHPPRAQPLGGRRRGRERLFFDSAVVHLLQSPVHVLQRGSWCTQARC